MMEKKTVKITDPSKQSSTVAEWESKDWVFESAYDIIKPPKYVDGTDIVRFPGYHHVELNFSRDLEKYAEKLYDKSVTHIEKGNYAAALESLEEAVKYEPGKYREALEKLYTDPKATVVIAGITEKRKKEASRRERNEKLAKIGLVVQLIITAGYFYVLWGTDIVSSLWLAGEFPRLLPLAAFSVVAGIISIVFHRSFGDLLIFSIVILVQAITASVWMGNVGFLIINLIGRGVLNIISCIPGLIMTFIAIGKNT